MHACCLFTLVPCFVNCFITEDGICLSKRSADFQQATRHYISESWTLQNKINTLIHGANLYLVAARFESRPGHQLTWDFRGFPEYLQANARITTSSRPRSFPFSSFHFFFHSSILSFHAQTLSVVKQTRTFTVRSDISWQSPMWVSHEKNVKLNRYRITQNSIN
jgi:hypothetical protein